MNTTVLLSDEELDTRAIRALVRELGPVESTRFLTRLLPPEPGTDSVKRRHEWLDSIDQDEFARTVLERINVDPFKSSEV